MDYSDIIYISEELGNSLSRTQVSAGDIVISQRGSLGQCAIVDDTFPKLNISANIIAIKNPKGVSAEFIRNYILSTVGQTLLERASSGQVQQKITTQDIADLLIPTKCDEQMLITIIDAGHIQYKNKVQQANDLLEGKRGYLFERLNLTFDNSESVLCYAQKHSMISLRIDADFYSPRFTHFRRQIEDSVYPTVQIGEICKSISSGFAAGKQDQADDLPDNERVPQLRPFSITPYGQISFATKKYVPISRLQEKDYCKKGEVLFNNTNSAEWVGKSTVFDIDTPCATSNHITRITLKEGINPYYIAAFFNMLRSIGYWKLLSTYFNNQAGVNTETLKAVCILLPKKTIQDEIAEEILRRKNTAEALRIEAEQDWEAAKAEFERKLLGE